MNSRELARTTTRALWVGGIALVALGATRGAARGETRTADAGRRDGSYTPVTAA
jgi:hypothetical protein